MIVTDPEGRIIFVNESAVHIHGAERLEVAPVSYADTYHLFTEDGQPYPFDELLEKVWHSGQSRRASTPSDDIVPGWIVPHQLLGRRSPGDEIVQRLRGAVDLVIVAMVSPLLMDISASLSGPWMRTEARSRAE